MLRVDLEKTKQYYSSLKQDDLCDCNYCKNYCQQVKTEFPEIASYLASLGIDIEKPFETNPLEPDSNGILEYCGCQYIIFGSYSNTYTHRIGDVTFHIASSYPSTNLEDEHFVLEFYPIKLKMGLRL